MISLTHRSRHFLLIFIICFLVYLTLDRIGSSNDDNRKSLFSKSKIHVFNNNNNHPIQKSFKFKLPKIQYDFDIETDEQVNNLLEKRRQAVKSSFMHGWNGYKTYALGSDELKPLTNTGYNPFGGLSATLIDSLSTMLIMDMKDEVGELIPMVEKMQFKVDEHLSVFETIIRLMGGLLSAYELSDDPRKYVFLKKAEEIGLMLLPAFESNTGLPPFKYNPLT
jgi:mannosyl-oligosaccharide alpha-1,2-mannosidase